MLSSVLLSVLEMLIPNGKTEKVVSFAVSLILLVVFLSPLNNVFNANGEDFIVKSENDLRESVQEALNEGEKMFSDVMDECLDDNVKKETIEALMAVGIEIETQDMFVDSKIGEDVLTIKVFTTNFNESEMKAIDENQSDLEVTLGTDIARRLGINRNMIRFYFEE